jgi:hypothetical protein
MIALAELEREREIDGLHGVTAAGARYPFVFTLTKV